MVDISRQSVAWASCPATGWADGYGFEPDADVVFLDYFLAVHLRSVERYAYRLSSGEFLEPARWSAGREGRMNSFDVLGEALCAMNRSDAAEAGRLAGLAIERGELVPYPAHHAKAWRVIGEAAELRGEIERALSAYARALEIDPKVGVKTRVQQLRGKRWQLPSR